MTDLKRKLAFDEENGDTTEQKVPHLDLLHAFDQQLQKNYDLVQHAQEEGYSQSSTILEKIRSARQFAAAVFDDGGLRAAGDDTTVVVSSSTTTATSTTTTTTTTTTDETQRVVQNSCTHKYVATIHVYGEGCDHNYRVWQLDSSRPVNSALPDSLLDVLYPKEPNFDFSAKKFQAYTMSIREIQFMRQKMDMSHDDDAKVVFAAMDKFCTRLTVHDSFLCTSFQLLVIHDC